MILVSVIPVILKHQFTAKHPSVDPVTIAIFPACLRIGDMINYLIKK